MSIYIPWFSRAALCSLQALISCSFLSLSSALSDGATHTHRQWPSQSGVLCVSWYIPGVSAGGVGSGTPFLAGVCFPFLAGLPYTEHNTHTHTLSNTPFLPVCCIYLPSLATLPCRLLVLLWLRGWLAGGRCWGLQESLDCLYAGIQRLDL